MIENKLSDTQCVYLKRLVADYIDYQEKYLASLSNSSLRPNLALMDYVKHELEIFRSISGVLDSIIIEVKS